MELKIDEKAKLLFAIMDKLIEFAKVLFDNTQSLQDKKAAIADIKEFCDNVIANREQNDLIDKILKSSDVEFKIDESGNVVDLAKIAMQYFSKKNEENDVTDEFAIISLSSIMFKFYKEIYNYYQNI